MEAFLVSIGTEDFSMMSKSLATMGATSENVDTTGLENDLREIFRGINNIDPNVLIAADAQRKPFDF